MKGETLRSARTLQLTRAEPCALALLSLPLLWVTDALGLRIVPAWVVLGPSLLSVPVAAQAA